MFSLSPEQIFQFCPLSVVTDFQGKILNVGEFFKDSLTIGTNLLDSFEAVGPIGQFNLTSIENIENIGDLAVIHMNSKITFKVKLIRGSDLYWLQLNPEKSADSESKVFALLEEKNALLKELEMTVKKAESFARFPWENPNPVMRINSDGKICDCNPASVSFLKSCKTETMNKFEQLILEASMTLGEAKKKRTIRASFDGIHYDLSFFYVKIHKCINVYLTNVSEEVRTRQLLEEERASSLSQNRILAVGEMAAGVSHEINNPLAIIRASISQLIKHQTDVIAASTLAPEKVARSFDRISRATDRIGNIVDGLRAFARDATDDPKQDENIENIIRDTLNLCNQKFAANGFQIQTQFESNLLFTCRRSQITNVIFQLLNNSYEALNGKNSPWIQIHAVRTDKWIQISITDSGYGIPTHISDKMMEPFFTTKSLGQGVGLGLSIAKGIIESHGGILSYCAQHPNTRFEILFPFLNADRNPISSAA
jgi:signal transduction histidine kinase